MVDEWRNKVEGNIISFGYKPEVPGFDYRWCHGNCSLTKSYRQVYGVRLNQALTEMSTRNISLGKSGRCVGVTNLPPLCANYTEIWELQIPENFSAYPGLWWDCFTFISFGNTDWLRTTSFTSVGMDRYRTYFRSEEQRGRSKTGYRLSQRISIHILRWRGIWKVVYSHNGVCEVSFPLKYDAKSPDTLFLKYWARLVAWKLWAKIRVTECHMAEQYDLHEFVYETQNSVLTFSPVYCK